MTVRIVILATVALAAAACGTTTKRQATPSKTTSTQSTAAPACKLTKAQRHAVALSLQDIGQLRKIQAPLHTFSEQGTPAQERVTGKFLLDMGRGNLPINERARLIRLAKSAVGLCGQCFSGLESAEPAVSGTRFGGEKRCG
jgi:hypothetical protein